MQHIYLDHAATTPIDPRVRRRWSRTLDRVFGNASSVHWHGRQTKSALEGRADDDRRGDRRPSLRDLLHQRRNGSG